MTIKHKRPYKNCDDGVKYKNKSNMTVMFKVLKNRRKKQYFKYRKKPTFIE